MDFTLLMFHNNIEKISEIYLKPTSKVPTLLIFVYFAAIFTMGKNANTHFFKFSNQNKTVCA